MTIASTITDTPAVANGSTTQFPFPNKIFSAADLVVTLTDLLGNIYTFTNFSNAPTGLSYTVQGVDVDTGCTVVFSAAPTNGWAVDIRSLIPELQSTSVKNQGQFLPELHEEAFDRLTRMIQDLLRLTYTYGIHSSDMETAAWPSLPLPAARKGLALIFDPVTGLPTVGIPTTQTLTQGLIGSLLYPQTQIETNASVTAVNTVFPGPNQADVIHAFRYMTPTQIADVVARTQTQDVTAAIQAACNACSVTGGTIFFPPGNYLISSAITVAGSSTHLVGQTRAVFSYAAGALIVATTNIQFFTVTGSWVLFENLGMYCSSNAHTQRHINMTTGNFMSVVNCYLQGVNSGGSATGGGIAFQNTSGADAGTVDRCVIDQGAIEMNTSDIHVTNSWLWANTRPYAVKVNGGSNCAIIGCDILPPQTNVTGLKAGIWVTGAALQCRILGCYLDGNATINTGPGILADGGCLNTIIGDCIANLMTDWAIILDSQVNPIVHHCTFYNGNRGRAALNGTVPGDVLLRQTGGQAMTNPTVSDCKHLYTTAPGGTAGPAIRVLTGTTQSGMLIERNQIVDPTLGGYSAAGIVMDDGFFASPNAGSLSKCSHAQRCSAANGSATFVATNTSVTISWPLNLFFQPRVDQVRITMFGQPLPFNVAVLNALQIQVTFPAAAGSGTVFASVDLN